jgi:uncharacterized membrane protein YgdD (TMEM256/DUF423 family)
MSKCWLIVAAVLGLAAVATGAIGDHLIQPKLAEWYPSDAEKRIENWEIASRYLFFHALAIGLVSVLPKAHFRRSRQVIAGFFLLGVVLFSGCLFAYTLTDVKPLVHFVPLGGLSFMLGWLALIVAAARATPTDS